MILPPGTNIQSAIDANPPGTVFQLAQGIYRGEQFQSKSNDKFIGDPGGGTILSGAIVLQGWTASGGYWVHAGLPPPRTGQVVAESNPLASKLNDLFVDNVLYRRVDRLSQVKKDTWYFDPKTNAAIIATDANGHTVEYSVTDNLTSDASGATGVEIRNLTIEKYATDAQVGPIQGVRDWHIIDVTSRQNHGAGLNIGAGTIVQGGHYNNNGQIGIDGWKADNTRVLGAEIAANNYAGYYTAWEAGGMKLAGSSHVEVSGNNVHDNIGQGLWSDIDDRNFTYEDNIVANNTGNGIMYEISFGGTVIHNNIITCNGGAGIYISNSSGVDVSGNTITVASTNAPGSNGAAGAGGIDIINDARGSGPNGLYQSIDNTIRDNTIIHRGDTAQDGTFIYQPITSSNSFDHDTYYVENPNTPHWHIGQNSYRWQAMVDASGLEQHGRMIVQDKPPPAACHFVKYGLSTGFSRVGATLHWGAAILAKRLKLGFPRLMRRDTDSPPADLTR